MILYKISRTLRSIGSVFRSEDMDFSAKVRWRMRYDKKPIYVTLQDKYEVREYARSKGVNMANLLYVTERPETIPFEEFPEKYFIKANHACNWNILCFNSKYYLFGDGKKIINKDGSFLNMYSAKSYELTKYDVI